MDDDLRRRLDTGCTVESKDSGIEVRRMKPPRRAERVIETKMGSLEPEGSWDIASILWIVVFILTAWIFHLPMSIWFSKKVDWNFMHLALILYTISMTSGLYLYVKYRDLNWRRQSPMAYATSVLFFLAGSISFCVATFALFGWMSAGICFVTLMFLLSLSEIVA